MALVRVGFQRGVSISSSALMKSEAIAHIVVTRFEDHAKDPHRPAGWDDPRIGVQPQVHRLQTACGKYIVGCLEPTYKIPAYIGKNWTPTLQKQRDCSICVTARKKKSDLAVTIHPADDNPYDPESLFG